MHLAVIIASVGRAELLRQTVDLLRHQTRQPDSITVVSVTEADVRALDTLTGLPLDIIFSELGLPRQRNAGLRHVAGKADYIAFFDDDFVPAPDYLATLERMFTSRRALVGVTAKLMADGIKSPGFDVAKGIEILEGWTPPTIIQERALPALYGCNLCVRAEAAQGIWFDETLPLYGWQEDVDFSYRLGAKGTLVYTNQLTGVHLGTKGGRTSGKKLGYSQIANPVYLLRKKTIPPRLAWRLMVRNFLANIIRSPFPEPYIDRVGRLQGNMTALVDLAANRIDPRRILQF
jgi:GT2 family glycosyltransferase